MIANLVGALLVLCFALNGGFLVNKNQAGGLSSLLSMIDPMSYGFEALMINEFHNAVKSDGEPVYYLINATFCADGLPPLFVLGDTILSTFDYPASYSVLDGDIWSLEVMALILLISIYPVLVWAPVVFRKCGKYSAMLRQCGPKLAGVVAGYLPFGPRQNGSSTGRDKGLDPNTWLGCYDDGIVGHRGGILTWQDVCLWVPQHGSSMSPLWCRNEKMVLQSVSGIAGPSLAEGAFAGDLCGLMGPSGAGKTSLLDVLAGRKNQGRITGSICLNGLELNPAQLRNISGYVVQEDILPGMLTVLEHLKFHARLRMDPEELIRPREGQDQMGDETKCLCRRVSSRHREYREAFVHDLMKQLGLDKVAHSLIGNAMHRGLSGGEKRRVSIAVELLSRPTVGYQSNVV